MDTNPTNDLSVGDHIKVVNSEVRGRIVETRCAHRIKVEGSSKEHWYLAGSLEALT